MKPTGIVRRLDDLGRIWIPKAVRQELGLRENFAMEIFVEDGSIVLRRYYPQCDFCGAGQGEISVGDKSICTRCANQLKDALAKQQDEGGQQE